jgi:hypothetical protein
MRKIVQVLILTGSMAAFAGSASAATLTLVDTYGGAETIWTLTVETGCVTCDVKLEGFFKDPAGGAVNPYTGTYLDSVQWVVSNPNVDPTDVGFQTTTAGTAANWEFDFDESLSAGQCGGGAQDAVCGEWISGGAGGGFGPIVNGSTLEWTFQTEFASQLPDQLVAGNIRAAFNTISKKGAVKNFNIFSPNGGTFQTSSTTSTPAATTTTTTASNNTNTSGSVPEPGMLSLLGIGLVVAGRRLRRKAA